MQACCHYGSCVVVVLDDVSQTHHTMLIVKAATIVDTIVVISFNIVSTHQLINLQ